MIKPIRRGMEKAISFGAGVNSIAMTIMLFKRGEIYPVIFADTMAEHPETYCYMDYFEKEFMSKYGQKIIRLTPPKSLEQYCLNYKMIPFHFARFCTRIYKIKPLTQYAEKNKITVQVIGFSYEERQRVKDIGLKKEYPLIEAKVNRQGCLEIIKAEGLTIPRKSSCFFCPFQRLNQWERLYKETPDLWGRAIAMEETAQLAPRKKEGLTTFLATGITLKMLQERFDGKGGDLFPDWDFEELEPCMCKL